MKVIVTEEQLHEIVREQVIKEQMMVNPNLVYANVMRMLSLGNIRVEDAAQYMQNMINRVAQMEQNPQTIPIIQKLTALKNNLLNKNQQVTNQMQADAEEQAGVWKNNLGNWKLVSDDTLATVYNAVPQQCNNDVVHTASMFKLNLADVLSQKVIAMERTFMQELGIKYGDVVYVQGTGQWDGPWQVQDTMNKRFAGMHKIDILVPRNIRHGKWENVKISVPVDDKTATNAKNTMKGSV